MSIFGNRKYTRVEIDDAAKYCESAMFFANGGCVGCILCNEDCYLDDYIPDSLKKRGLEK
jgi:hypothetical protein